MIFLRFLGVIALLLLAAYERRVRRRELRRQPVYRPADLVAEPQPDKEARLALFASGARYRIRKTFKSTSLFVEGEDVMFESVRHDPYDRLFAYIFSSGLGTKTFLMSGNDPIDAWKDFFAPL